MVCGTDNGVGMHSRFFELDNGEIVGVFTPREEFQGYPGRLHGGIAATLLDEAMGRAINVTDLDAWGVTVELSFRYRQPVPLDSEVRAVARVTRDTSRLFESSGEIVLADGTVAVEATGKYMRLSIDKIATGDFDGEEWGPDERPRPTEIDLD